MTTRWNRPVRGLIIAGDESANRPHQLLELLLGPSEQVKVFGAAGESMAVYVGDIIDAEIAMGHLVGLIDDGIADDTPTYMDWLIRSSSLMRYLAEFDVAIYVMDSRKPFPAADAAKFDKLRKLLSDGGPELIIVADDVKKSAAPAYRKSVAAATAKFGPLPIYAANTAAEQDHDKLADLFRHRLLAEFTAATRRKKQTGAAWDYDWAKLAAAVADHPDVFGYNIDAPATAAPPKLIANFAKLLMSHDDIEHAFVAAMKLPLQVRRWAADNSKRTVVADMVRCFHIPYLPPKQVLALFSTPMFFESEIVSDWMAGQLAAGEREEAATYPTVGIYLIAESKYNPIIRICYMSAEEIAAAKPQISEVFQLLDRSAPALVSTWADVGGYETRRRWWPNADGVNYANCGTYNIIKRLARM